MGNLSQQDSEMQADKSLKVAEQIGIQLRNVSLTVKQGKRQKSILHDVSARIRPGSVTALMGSSGSGKSSLLNLLAGRISQSQDSSVHVDGQILFNGRPVSRQQGLNIGYCQQNDYLLPYLTTRETLIYSAMLKSGAGVTKAEILRQVDAIIDELDLKLCRNTIIGDSLQRGVSGGERRRVSVGVQLLSHCSLLFMDEATSGLDAYSAFQLVKVLQRLARDGHTIVLSIHQPRKDIFDLFDSVIVLSRGECCYGGGSQEAVGYLSQLGYTCPTEQNFADFLVGTCTVDTTSPQLELKSQEVTKDLIAMWTSHASNSEIDYAIEMSSPLTLSKRCACRNVLQTTRTFVREVDILTRRTVLNLRRDRVGTLGVFLASLSIGLVVGYIFYQLPINEAGLRSRAGVSYAVTGLQPYLFLILNIFRLCEQLRVFDRERKDKMYSTPAYLVSYMLANAIPMSLSHIIFTTIVYFMGNLRPSFELVYFARYTFSNLLHSWCIVSLAWFGASVSREFAVASLVANSLMSTLTLNSGFFVATKSLPVYIKWIRYGSSFWYTYRIALSAVFTDQTFVTSGDGNAFLLSQESEPNLFASAIGYQFLLWATTATLTTLLLQFRVPSVGYKLRSDGKKPLPSNEVAPLLSHVVDVKAEEIVKVASPSVDVKNLSITLVQSGVFKSTDKQILSHVSATFQTGHLNVILGGSGSGKSTLLNSIAGRNRSTPLLKFEQDGEIALLYPDGGRQLMTTTMRRHLMAYVTQDDDKLLPSLTVRETLTYAAGLRLPPSMSRKSQLKRVNDLILRLGLKDCANTFVGNEFIRGISGGEKRRLSVAVQLLQDSTILLCDEPTSGLDSLNARSLMVLLKTIATGDVTGKMVTVICTIHQPQSEIYDTIDNVVLLGRGSLLIYSGKRVDMLNYFREYDLICPPLTNPADYALDVSIIHRDMFLATRTVPIVEQKTLQIGSSSGRVQTYEKMKRIGTLRSIPLLLSRSYTNIFRQYNLVIARVSQVVAFGAILTLHFAPLGHDQASVQTRYGVIQEHLALLFLGLLNCLAVFPQEKNAFFAEHEEGVVSTSAFSLVYLLTELPFEIVSAFLFVGVTDYAGGFQMDFETSLKYALIAFAQVSVGESLGIVLQTLLNNPGLSVSFTNLLLSSMAFLSGILSLNIAPVLQAINTVAPTYYSAQILVNREFENIVFTCSDSERLTFPLPNGTLYSRCPIQNGRDAIRAYNFDTNVSKYDPLTALILCVIGYRVLAFVVMVAQLKFKR